jgi:uncharacterized membrane protein YfcA
MEQAKFEQTRALILMGLGTLIGSAVGWIASFPTDTYLSVWIGASIGCIAAIGIAEWTDWLPIRRG